MLTTDGETLRLDGTQYANDEGSCLEVLRTDAVVRVDDSPSDHRYPQFAKDVQRVGVRSSMSVPVSADGENLGMMHTRSTVPPRAWLGQNVGLGRFELPTS